MFSRGKRLHQTVAEADGTCGVCKTCRGPDSPTQLEEAEDEERGWNCLLSSAETWSLCGERTHETRDPDSGVDPQLGLCFAREAKKEVLGVDYVIHSLLENLGTLSVLSSSSTHVNPRAPLNGELESSNQRLSLSSFREILLDNSSSELA